MHAHLPHLNALGTLRRKVKSRKLVYDASAVQELSAEEVLPYEEVVKIAPQNNRPRPIFLVSTHSEVKAQAVINHMILNQTQGVLFSLPGKRSHPSSVARRDVVSVHEVLQVMETGKTAILSIPPQVSVYPYVDPPVQHHPHKGPHTRLQQALGDAMCFCLAGCQDVPCSRVEAICHLSPTSSYFWNLTAHSEWPCAGRSTHTGQKHFAAVLSVVGATVCNESDSTYVIWKWQGVLLQWWEWFRSDSVW